jgi:hypothetical protein
MAIKKLAETTEQPGNGAVQVFDSTGGMMERPDYIESGHEGAETMTQDDIQMPRLAIAQKMSYEIDPSHPKFIDGLKIGDFFNTLTKRIYGKGPFKFCVVKRDPPKFIEFRPRAEGGGVKDLNVPPDDPRATEWRKGPNGESLPPLATRFYEYVIVLMLGDETETLVLSLKNTGIKVAKEFNGYIMGRNAPVYTGVYSVAPVPEKNAKGDFFNYMIRNAGWLSKEQIAAIKNMYEGLKNTVINVEREAGDEDPTEHPSGEQADAPKNGEQPGF